MKKPKIIYCYDALCGWCYGFSSTLEKLQKAYNDKLFFEPISGGLFVGARVGLINDVAPFIKEAYKIVEDKTGVEFGERFIQDGLGNNTMLMNSLYPSIALCIVKKYYPEMSLAFSSKLLEAFYVDGISSDELDKYNDLVEEMELNIPDFNIKMKEDTYKKMAEDEFSYCASQKVGGFPSLILEINGEKKLLSNGHVDFDSSIFSPKNLGSTPNKISIKTLVLAKYSLILTLIPYLAETSLAL